MVICFWCIFFHPLVKFFSEIKNLIFSLYSSNTINPNFFFFSKFDRSITRLEKHIDSVDQIESVDIFIFRTKEIFGNKISISTFHNTDSARIFGLYKTLNTSVFDNIDNAVVQLTNRGLLKHIQRSPQSVTDLMTNHKIVNVLGHFLFFPDRKT